VSPENENPSLKDPELYDKIRQGGASKEKAARISNAAAASGRSEVGKKGGASPPYEEWTVPELRARAKELGLSGYSRQKKAVVIRMLREH
jgi:hypothetical protein